MLVVAVVAGVLGHLLLPRILVWLLVAMLIWAAVTTWLRTIDRAKGSLPPDHGTTEQHRHDGPRSLKPGESFDKAVKLTWAPNVPTAEAMCTHLRANGIEAFYKRLPTFEALSAVTSDFDPAEVWVAEHDLRRARDVLVTT
jgi:hypothetical protein